MVTIEYECETDFDLGLDCPALAKMVAETKSPGELSDMHDRCARMILSGTRPLQTSSCYFLAVQTCMADTCEGRCH